MRLRSLGNYRPPPTCQGAQPPPPGSSEPLTDLTVTFVSHIQLGNTNNYKFHGHASFSAEPGTATYRLKFLNSSGPVDITGTNGGLFDQIEIFLYATTIAVIQPECNGNIYPCVYVQLPTPIS